MYFEGKFYADHDGGIYFCFNWVFWKLFWFFLLTFPPFPPYLTQISGRYEYISILCIRRNVKNWKRFWHVVDMIILVNIKIWKLAYMWWCWCYICHKKHCFISKWPPLPIATTCKNFKIFKNHVFVRCMTQKLWYSLL